MSDQNSGQGDKVAAVANRLRLLQIDFADQGDQVRCDYLKEELGRTLASLPPAERKPFLEELQARFPTWDGKVELARKPVDIRPSFDEKELNDASFLLTRLIKVCESMPAEKRAAVV